MSASRARPLSIAEVGVEETGVEELVDVIPVEVPAVVAVVLCRG